MASKEDLSIKPQKFNGLNFKRWKSQVRYWLTVLGYISAIEENNENVSFSSWLNLNK
jgi:hypothetical protein